MQNQFPKNWRKVKLGEVVDINPRQINKDNFHKEIEYVDISAVGTATLESTTTHLLSEAPGRARRLVKNGDTIISTVRPNRRSFYYFKNPTDNLVVSTGFAVLSSKLKITDSRFIYYLVTQKSFTHYLTSNVKGSAYPAITTDVIENAEVLIPAYEEQNQIASILSSFDDKIEVNIKIAKTLEETAQVIFKEWFKKFKFPGHEKVKMIDSELGKIPEGWEIKKLSDLVSTQYGYTESASEKEIGPRFLRVMDINKSDWIDWSSVPYCKINDKDLLKYRLSAGDVVIARMADPGKVAIIEENVNAVFASYLIRLKPLNKSVGNYFLYFYLTSSQYQGFIFGSSTGTTRQSANARVITDCYLAVPKDEIIKEFETIANLLRKMIQTKVKENQKLAEMRDLLLPKLMRGELRV